MPHTDTCDKLGLRCIAHLEQEEAMLQATETLLVKTRRCLLDREFEQAVAHLDSQTHTQSAARQLTKTRMELRADIASQLGLATPTQVLDHLESTCSDEISRRIAAQRSKLVRIVERIDLLNRANAAFMNHYSHLLGTLLDHLTGSNGTTSRYSRSGKINERTSNPVLEKDC